MKYENLSTLQKGRKQLAVWQSMSILREVVAETGPASQMGHVMTRRPEKIKQNKPWPECKGTYSDRQWLTATWQAL